MCTNMSFKIYIENNYTWTRSSPLPTIRNIKSKTRQKLTLEHRTRRYFVIIYFIKCKTTFQFNSLLYISHLQGVSTKFQYFLHDLSMTEALKLRTFLHALWHERDMYQGHALPLRPRAPVGFAFENHSPASSHSTGRYQNLIRSHKHIPVLKSGWKKGTTPFRERMPFNFHDFSKTWSQFPWLFQAWKKIMEFHDFSRFSMTGYTLHLGDYIIYWNWPNANIFHVKNIKVKEVLFMAGLKVKNM